MANLLQTCAATCLCSPVVCSTGKVSATCIYGTSNGYFMSGPNSTWGCYLIVGGNGNNSGHATVATTNGNLHLDAKPSSGLYLNHYSSAGGIYSCGAFYNCTCFHAPRMCATTCLRSANVCATTAVYSPIVCATSCVNTPLVTVIGTQNQCLSSTTHSLKVKNTGSTITLMQA